jgi:hypothetical protein
MSMLKKPSAGHQLNERKSGTAESDRHKMPMSARELKGGNPDLPGWIPQLMDKAIEF